MLVSQFDQLGCFDEHAVFKSGIMGDSCNPRSVSGCSLFLYSVFVILTYQERGVAGFTATLLGLLFLKQHLSETIEYY